MKKKIFTQFLAAAALLSAFVLWTVALGFLDVQPIGPNRSCVGFATLNGYVHRITGVHMILYHLTDWLSLIPLGFILGFGLLGLMQWVQRRSLWKVDFSILILGAYYIVVMVCYLLFESLVINFRPVLINGVLEPSYPSSTTMLVLCVMPTAILQLRLRIQSNVLRKITTVLSTAFLVFMVLGRLLSGVHWITDIIGGTLLSGGLFLLYIAVCNLNPKQ